MLKNFSVFGVSLFKLKSFIKQVMDYVKVLADACSVNKRMHCTCPCHTHIGMRPETTSILRRLLFSFFFMPIGENAELWTVGGTWNNKLLPLYKTYIGVVGTCFDSYLSIYGNFTARRDVTLMDEVLMHSWLASYYSFLLTSKHHQTAIQLTSIQTCKPHVTGSSVYTT